MSFFAYVSAEESQVGQGFEEGFEEGCGEYVEEDVGVRLACGGYYGGRHCHVAHGCEACYEDVALSHFLLA